MKFDSGGLAGFHNEKRQKGNTVLIKYVLIQCLYNYKMINNFRNLNVAALKTRRIFFQSTGKHKNFKVRFLENPLKVSRLCVN